MTIQVKIINQDSRTGANVNVTTAYKGGITEGLPYSIIAPGEDLTVSVQDRSQIVIHEAFDEDAFQKSIPQHGINQVSSGGQSETVGPAAGVVEQGAVIDPVTTSAELTPAEQGEAEQPGLVQVDHGFEEGTYRPL
jgi:hypothetical protein